MRRILTVGLVTVAAAVACHRRPVPTLEYGETVTYTSTAADPVPQVADHPAAPAAAAPQDEEAPVGDASAAAVPADASDVSADGWNTTVQTADRPDESADAADAPPASGAAVAKDPPAPPRQWYKAKRW